MEYQKEQFHLDGDEEYLVITIKGINQMQEKLSMIAEIKGIQPQDQTILKSDRGESKPRVN